MSKKNFIGLSLLLLVLLLGLFSTSYAFTSDEVNNLIYNILVNHYSLSDSNAKQYITDYSNTIENAIASYKDNDDYAIIGFKQRGSNSPIFLYIAGTQKRSGQYNNGYMSNGSWKQYINLYYQLQIYSNKPLTNSYNSYSYNAGDTDYLFAGTNIYQTNNSTIQYNQGYHTPDWFTDDGPYSQWVAPDYDFEITYLGGDITYKLLDKDGHVIQDDGVDRIYYYLGTSAFSYERLGNLINSKSTEVVTFELYAYDTKKKDYMLFKSKYGYNEHIDLSYINSVYQTTISGDFWISEIGVTSDYLIENTILEVNFYSSEDNLRYYFYCVGDNTMFSTGNITGGTISPSLTFSGDYNKDYNDNLKDDTLNDNINNINDTLTDNSQVDGMLAEFTSGDFASNIGFVERENPFQTFILQFVYEICDVLLASGDVYFDYSMHGETPHRIYASSFTTPETPLKAFLRLAMIFGALYILYNQFRQVVELINTGNAASVLQTEDADMYFYKM